MIEHETWDPNRTRKVEDLDGMRELIFEALADPLARMSCACPECDPAPHETTGLATFGEVIEVEIDDAQYKITVTRES